MEAGSYAMSSRTWSYASRRHQSIPVDKWVNRLSKELGLCGKIAIQRKRSCGDSEIATRLPQAKGALVKVDRLGSQSNPFVGKLARLGFVKHMASW